MTWWQNSEDAENFSVFFNRDESKERSIAEPPAELRTEFGTRYLMPTDPDAGGTWMFVNERGVVVALLNWYDKAVPYAGKKARFRSRGLLVKGLADICSLAELEKRLNEATGGAAYRPFHILGFAPNESPCGWSWDGETVSSALCPAGLTGNDSTGTIGGSSRRLNGGMDLPLPLISSSSFETERVLRSRRDAFLKLNPKTKEDFVSFQTNSGEPATAFTPRMNRPDAQTWSRSEVSVSRSGIVFKYVAELADLSGEANAFETYLKRS